MKKVNLKEARGITLVALVVTIIILLILAGVALSLVIGENGLIKQIENAKIETRTATVKEEIDLWRAENEVRKNSSQKEVSKEKMLQNLKDKGIIEEREINRAAEVIKIGENEINYGVIVTIRKIPENAATNAVLIELSIDDNIKLESEEQYSDMLEEKLKGMEDEEKECLYVELVNMFSEQKINSFDDVIESAYNNGELTENSKEAFYREIGRERFNLILIEMIIALEYNLIGIFNSETNTLIRYEVLNPDGEEQMYYIAKKNGEYTFTIENLENNQQFEKKVIVDNISDVYEYSVDNMNLGEIRLKNTITGETTTFSKAYIIFNNKTVDISDLIQGDKNMNYISGWDIRQKLGRDVAGTRTFILEKDGIIYVGEADVNWNE